MVDIIILEDEPVLLEELGEFLESCGYATTCAATLREFDRLFDPSRHVIAILDLGLPDGNGLRLIERLRENGLHVGIIVFSARGASPDKVLGLDIGADHYLGKGCDLDELAATVSALARRLDVVQRGCWRLELGPRRLHAPGAEPITLSQQDATVLYCLMRQPGKIASRQDIVKALGADFLDYEQQRLDTQMSRLRRKIQDRCGIALPIKTLRNQGYCFYATVDIRA